MADALTLGERVEARFGGGPGYHPSIIDAENDDGTYAVKYDDGDFEPAVNRLRIRRPGDVDPETLAVGMPCEARHGGNQYVTLVIYDHRLTITIIIRHGQIFALRAQHCLRIHIPVRPCGNPRAPIFPSSGTCSKE
mmetsp:Transcript_89695/g.256329  ORF Transcript_89695/g.256329 Transcript_89695/m.256329 type:complete len:136 (+) Transcript_89695:102-509(+)